MVAFIATSSFLNLIGEVFVFSWAYFIASESLERARTMTFMFVVLFELIVVWNCRSEKHNAFKMGFLSNKYLRLGSDLLHSQLGIRPVTGGLYERQGSKTYEKRGVIEEIFVAAASPSTAM